MRRLFVGLLTFLLLLVLVPAPATAQQRGRLVRRSRTDTTKVLTRGHAAPHRSGAASQKTGASHQPGAQVPIPQLAIQCQEGCGGGDTGSGGDSYEVSVTPDGGTPVSQTPYTTGHTAIFTVHNSGAADSYTASCAHSDSIVCASTLPSNFLLGAGGSRTVTVTYSTLGAAPSQWVELDVAGQASDEGTVNVALGTFAVSVTPDGGTAVSKTPWSTGNTATFVVKNTGTISDDFLFGVAGSTDSLIVTANPSPGRATLSPGDSVLVAVPYSTRGANASSWIKLMASGASESLEKDSGQVNVSIAPPAGAPVVSLTPHNSSSKGVAGCVAACFDATWSHSTPAYFTMGRPRALTLAYNSGTVAPIVTVSLDVSAPSQSSATSFSFQVKRLDTGTFLNFLNGSTALYFTASGTQVNRVVLPIDARADSLKTGSYPIAIIATSHLSGGATADNIVHSTLIVVDEGGSAFGAGVNIVGLPRVYGMADGAALVTSGDGSAASYRCLAVCGTTPIPGGASSALAHNGDGTWALQGMDGSLVKFASNGRVSFMVGQFSDTTKFTWTDTLLTRITDPRGGIIALTYDGTSHKLLQVADSLTGAAQRKTTYTVTNGTLVKITDPDSLYTQFTYDSAGRLQTMTDRSGVLSLTVKYDGLYRVDSLLGAEFHFRPPPPAEMGPPLNPTVEMHAPESLVWGVSGSGSSGSPKGAVKRDTLVTRVTDPNGNTTTLILNRYNEATRTVDAVGGVTVAVYDTAGRMTRDTTVSGEVDVYTYGGTYSKFIPTSTTRTIGAQTRVVSYGHDAYNNLTAIVGDVDTTRYTYTGTHALATVSVSGTVMATHYPNRWGQDTAIVDNASHRTRFLYDSTGRGNLLRSVDPRGNTMIYALDPYGRDTSVTAPLSGTSYVVYDKLNRVTTTKDPYGHQVQTTYDALSRVVQVKDKKNQVYHFTYSAMGLVGQSDLADSNAATGFSRGLNGEVLWMTNRRGQLLSFTYDALGRMTGVFGPDFPADSFSYSTDGRAVVAWNANGRDTLFMDQGGRLTHSAQVLNGQRWTFDRVWDLQDRLTSRSNMAGYGAAGYDALSRTYNGTSMMTGYTEANVHADLTHNTERLVSAIVYGMFGMHAWTASLSFDALHDDSTATYTGYANLNSTMGASWDFDSLGRLTRQNYNANALDRQFQYDSLGQLLKTCDNATASWATCDASPATYSERVYKYDAAGNRQLSTETSGDVGGGNRVVHTNGWHYTFDADGNVRTKCNSNNGCSVSSISYVYTWNALGQLTKVQHADSTLVVAFKYDALGRRIEKDLPSDTVRFVYDGDQVILDLNKNNSVRAQYGYEPGAIDAPMGVKDSASGMTAVFLRDPVNGTVRALAKEDSARLIKYYVLDPWGKPTTADTGLKTRFRMAGREFDEETGLYYDRARYYDPDAGRFLSEDPLGIAGGMNLYAYGLNDPVNQRDPSGLDAACPDGYNEVGTETHTDGDHTYVVILCQGATQVGDITVTGGSSLPFVTYPGDPGGPAQGNWGNDNSGVGPGRGNASQPKMAPKSSTKIDPSHCEAALMDFAASVTVDALFGVLSEAKAAASGAKTLVGALRAGGLTEYALGPVGAGAAGIWGGRMWSNMTQSVRDGRGLEVLTNAARSLPIVSSGFAAYDATRACVVGED